MQRPGDGEVGWGGGALERGRKILKEGGMKGKRAKKGTNRTKSMFLPR